VAILPGIIPTLACPGVNNPGQLADQAGTTLFVQRRRC
jgi:hypothetical protein